MSLNISVVTTQKEKELCFQIRHRVFVEEQGVPQELELDEHDKNDKASVLHFLGKLDSRPVAASRILRFDDVAKIQRFAVLKEFRGLGYGRMLMQAMMDYIQDQQLARVMALDAQIHAVGFYQSLGFIAEGEEFEDAGIPHIHMRRQANGQTKSPEN